MSANNSSTTKTVTVDCPAGTTVIGGGGYVGGTTNQAFITGLEPVVAMNGTGYRTTATEDETGYAGDWYVVGYVLCAPAPAGLEYRSASTTSSSQSSQGVSATCTTGKQVLGTGAVVNGGGREVGLSHMLPTPDALTHVAAVAHEDETGYGGMWSVTAFAVCANPPPRLQRVIAFPTTHRNSAVAVCPDGTQVHGIGGYLSGGWGEVRLVGAHPFFLTAGYLVGGEDETGYAGSWSPVAVIICAS